MRPPGTYGNIRRNDTVVHGPIDGFLCSERCAEFRGLSGEWCVISKRSYYNRIAVSGWTVKTTVHAWTGRNLNYMGEYSRPWSILPSDLEKKYGISRI